MLYKVISDWVSEKIEILNDTHADQDKVKAVNLNFDMDMLPGNLRDNTYLIKLGEVSFSESESEEILVSVKIEFHFRLYKKPVEIYRKLIDEKLYRLCTILSDDTASGLEYISNGITIANIGKIKISQIDKAYKGGEYIFPVVEFELQVFSNE